MNWGMGRGYRERGKWSRGSLFYFLFVPKLFVPKTLGRLT
jgi:hypothetical protein